MTQRKKQVYVAVIALGGVGLIVDRLVTPSSTQADSAALAPGAESAARGRPGPRAANSPGSMDLSVPELPFPRVLPSWDAGEPIRDIFSSVQASAASDKRRARATGDVEGHGTCAHLIKNCRVDALMVNERLRIAIINGERMQVGRELHGCKLFSVEGHEVRFRCDDGEAVITLSPATTTVGG